MSKVMLSSRRNARFHFWGFSSAVLARRIAQDSPESWDIFGVASFTNALPVPMLGQVYVGGCFRRGETLIFGVWVLKVVLPSRRNAHFRILGHLRAILSYLGFILGDLGAILGHLGAILGHLGAILGHLGVI